MDKTKLWMLPLIPIAIAVGLWATSRITTAILNRLAIRKGKRLARYADNICKKEVKRLAKQEETGKPIFRMLQDQWRLAGSLTYQKVSIHRDIYGTCCVSVDNVDDGGFVVSRLLNVVIDFRQPWNRQVAVTVGDHKQWPDTHSAHRQIKYLVDHFQIFKS